ncbi:MAG: methyltransferase domain-containing protein [Acidimicrobiia bacterium]|nr:methyltransferase domain-containing protein [Acidimicrobiia bacterium]
MSFTDMGVRAAVQCAGCGSLERTRLIKLVIDDLDLLGPSTRVLHIAPEAGLARSFVDSGADCRFVDLDPVGLPGVPGVERLDLCRDLDAIADRSFDLIVHSHVLEHVPCNYTYVLFHLHRLLAEEGRIVCCIPFLPGHYGSDTSSDLTDDQRNERYGQWDHVRRFGTDDLDLSLGRVYDLPETYDARNLVSEQALSAANVPPHAWTGFTPHSVLVLAKRDYRLA